MSANDRKDVTIRAPAAQAFSRALIPGGPLPLPEPEELCKLLEQESQGLARQVEELRITASTVANVALSLTQVLYEHGLAQRFCVVVPRELSNRMIGASLTVSETAAGDVLVRVRERCPVPAEREAE